MTPGCEPVLGNHAWQQPGPGQASSYIEPVGCGGLWGGAGLALRVQQEGLMPLPELQASLSTWDFSFRGASASLRTCLCWSQHCDFWVEEEGRRRTLRPKQRALVVVPVFGGM